MSAKLPKFVPILSSYTTRVSGRGTHELLKSPAGLARALADTQRIVGQDGVLCFYAPEALAASCLQSANILCAAEDVRRAGNMAVVIDAIVALRTLIPPSAQIIGCCPGPGLTLFHLRACCARDTPELADYDYVGDVFVTLIRAVCEAGAHGIAVGERFHDRDGATEGLYTSARKLADFYGVPLFVFLQPGSEILASAGVADCVFKLPENPSNVELLGGSLVERKDGPVTTNQDVPSEFSVEALQRLRAQATG